MTARDWTAAELDAMAGAYYRACHQDDASTLWEDLPDWRRWRHRRGVRAMLVVRDTLARNRMGAPYNTPQEAAHRRSIRLDRERTA